MNTLATPYSAFDYLCNESYLIQDIGYVKCPTLRDIRKITYNMFLYYLSIISCNVEEFLDTNPVSEDSKNNLSTNDNNSFFLLLLKESPVLLLGLISLFVDDEVVFDKDALKFCIFKVDGETKTQVGYIGSDNFDFFREQLQYILGIKFFEEKEQKFKNKLAQKMYEKLQKHTKEQKKKSDDNYSLDNMVRKYCTHNKVGINILNVWDLTYYQFVQMFNEYCNGRQSDFNDMMAANTFSYKKSTDYKPLEYMTKLKTN